MDLLKQLYCIHSPFYREWPMTCFIREYIRQHVPEAEVQMDSWGNLYIKKSFPFGGRSEWAGYPTLVCHLDQVQELHSEDFEVRQDGDRLYGWSEKNQQREGLGADDKNGLYICLRCLEECPCIKVFMAVGEEKGCIGSNRADMSFFSDSLYVLEPDCKGGQEVHINLKGVSCASDEFIKAMQLEANDYTLTDGKGSDIFPLTLNGIDVSCANIPAGYHNPHKGTVQFFRGCPPCDNYPNIVHKRYIKKGTSATPCTCALKPLIFEFRDSAEAFECLSLK